VKLVERTFELRGSDGLGGKPRPDVIGPVLSRVHGTLLDSVRMSFLHSSHARGRVPASLQAVSDARYVGHSGGADGSTLLRFEVPEFGDAASELFAQAQFWPGGPKPEQTAFELLAESLRDVRKLSKNSERFDHALLRRFAGYRRLLRGGLNSIALPDAEVAEVERIDEPLSAAAEGLSRETPPSRRVRLCGRLDLLGVSRQVMGLFIEDGTAVTAVWMPDGFVDLAVFLNRQVTIEGLAEFRPSGALLRVDADAIREAAGGDLSFGKLPLPETGFYHQKEAAKIRPGQKPYAAIFGLIPGDEPDEEFATAVAELD
jgi:hypothetical protein